MDRLIAVNSVNLAGADTAPATGTPQYATDGDPGGGVPATLWPAYQYNAIQEELIGVLVAAGVAPDKDDNAQLAEAIPILANARTVVNATWGVTQNIPNNVLTDVKAASAAFIGMASSYNAATGKITIAAGDEGYYLIQAEMNLLVAAAYGFFMGVYINGAANQLLGVPNVAGLPQGMAGTAIGVRFLSAGDEILVKTHQTSGGAVNLTASFTMTFLGKQP